MSPSSSAHTTVMDQRGFLFALPHLGLPEPEGEWRLLKAAIATKAEALDPLLNDKALQTPLRNEGEVRVPIEFEGALWILALPEPRSNSATTGTPEFFNVKARRLFPDAISFSTRKVPSDCDWIFVPMFVYQNLVASFESAEGDEDGSVGIVFEAGSASAVKEVKEKAKKNKKKKSSSKPEREISEWDVLSSNIFNDEWARAAKINAMVEEAKRGDPISNTEGVRLRLRIHPAEDHDYRSIDYLVVSETDKEKGNAVAEERWKPLPSGATKPGAERYFVNICREGKGQKPFTKEEWSALRR